MGKLESANTEGQRRQRTVLSAEGVFFVCVFFLPQSAAQPSPPGGLGEIGESQRALIPGPSSSPGPPHLCYASGLEENAEFKR